VAPAAFTRGLADDGTAVGGDWVLVKRRTAVAGGTVEPTNHRRARRVRCRHPVVSNVDVALLVMD
jgi:hypothetical protein